jgi:hypothetical protein
MEYYNPDGLCFRHRNPQRQNALKKKRREAIRSVLKRKVDELTQLKNTSGQVRKRLKELVANAIVAKERFQTIYETSLEVTRVLEEQTIFYIAESERMEEDLEDTTETKEEDIDILSSSATDMCLCDG